MECHQIESIRPHPLQIYELEVRIEGPSSLFLCFIIEPKAGVIELRIEIALNELLLVLHVAIFGVNALLFFIFNCGIRARLSEKHPIDLLVNVFLNNVMWFIDF